MNMRCTRRRFLKNTALAGIGWTILKDSRSARGAPANEKLNLAIIGCGGRGRSFAQLTGCCAQGSNPDVNVAFLCDVNEQKAAPAFSDFPEARKGNDYRVMLEKYHKEIDAVIVATGDYGHAPASLAAMRCGKPVYCEKPLTVAVREARMMAKMAAKKKVVTQMGNQGGYDPKAVNMVWGGMIGDVREAHCWMVGRGSGRRPLPSGAHPIPQGFYWDLWLGPSPYRDYHPAWWQGWNSWREFGTSGLGNRGSHSMASVFKALKIGELWDADPAGPHPTIKISAECPDVCLYRYPLWERAKWEVPARKDMPPVTVNWYFGDHDYFEPRGLRAFFEKLAERRLDWGDAGEGKYNDWLDSILVGEKGKMHFDGMAHMKAALPKDEFMNITPPELLPKPLGAPGLRGFYDAIKGGPAAMSCFDGFSGRYIEFLLLAHVATLFPGEELEFDPIDCRITNNPLADRALSRPYRAGSGMDEA